MTTRDTSSVSSSEHQTVSTRASAVVPVIVIFTRGLQSPAFVSRRAEVVTVSLEGAEA